MNNINLFIENRFDLAFMFDDINLTITGKYIPYDLISKKFRNVFILMEHIIKYGRSRKKNNFRREKDNKTS